MSYIRIEKLIDLDVILAEPMYLSGDESEVQKEIYENMWGIILTDQIIPYITLSDLEEFFSNLLDTRMEELSRIKPAMKATLYIWFDDMALKLCFNILSGEDRELPFGCKLNILDSPQPIFKNFLSVARNNFLYGNHLQLTNILEKGDPRCNDDYDDDDEEEIFNNYVLDVWKITLPFEE